MKSILKKVTALLCATIAFFTIISSSVITVLAEDKSAKIADKELKSTIEGLINWKKADNGSDINGYLINNIFLELAGSTPGDWYPIGLGRYSYSDDYNAYLAVITDNINERYKSKEKLHSAKATEWHRISLAVLAMGGDPTAIGKDINGKPINLIADGTYNRGKTASLGRQGINGWIWGLITLDSLRYKVPNGSFNTREDIIKEILSRQLSDGGFALHGKISDPDITAMALQALAPYYNDEKTYTYQQKVKNSSVTKSVRQVVDESLLWLSKVQTNEGDYLSWGTQNVESTCQVVVALCSLGINPETDQRFIKNGNNLIDGIMKYRMPDGGFIHSKTYDKDNPTSLPNKSNSMAGEQVLYTLVALHRYRNQMRNLYDFRPEFSKQLRLQINDVIKKIDSLTSTTSKSQIQSVYSAYQSIPLQERCYITNYYKLSDLMKNTNVVEDSSSSSDKGNKPTTSNPSTSSTPNPEIPSTEDTDENKPSVEEKEEAVILYFSESDKKAVDNLPNPLTTEHYVFVTKLLFQLENSEDFDGKEVYKTKLIKAKEEIANVQKEIDSINADILEKLYPFEKQSLKDKTIIDSIVRRYHALSKYDQSKINRYEDVIKTKTKVDNLLRAIIITIVAILICVIVSIFVVLRIKKKMHKKQTEMEKLAAQYEEEE